MKLLKNGILLGLLISPLACTTQSTPQVHAVLRAAPSGNQYAVLTPHHLAIEVTTRRPAPEDGRYLLSVAAAYTDLETDQPLDLLVCQGQALQTIARGYLDGMLRIVGDSLSISSVPQGQSPTPAQLANVQRQHGTLLLQELLVLNGRNVRAPGGSVFQRRALVEWPRHEFAVVESTDELTMQQFAADLVSLGARNALYLDMGGWDEGWYKPGGWYQADVVRLGRRRTDTARQSNWLVFAKPAR
ncbi:hypothetical protein MUN81_14400 [Hymenobacter sp. 5317J-9]|uniref:hypothetical protein n=1 Tax=Hymenobacter sp. 5317J-9 TaxID=2932250 RepID=UPI001FD6A642|nr:hypothetical protein [Hymenobacter sp. 5317J-9]UOQ96433.1 hypothetical protein MUN81_14400 [Hymenobacter sp. 5317J-9]